MRSVLLAVTRPSDALGMGTARVNPLIIVISGPSGVGKDAIVERIVDLGDAFYFTVTATTRPPRPNEVHGVNHIFVSTQEFRAMIAQGELLEWAETYGNLYGTPKDQVRSALSNGQHVLLRVDVQGAMAVKRLVPDALLVFISAPDTEVLAGRLRQRGVNDAGDIATRLDAADAESKFADQFDYDVVNREGELSETVRQILGIIDRESNRVPPRIMEL